MNPLQDARLEAEREVTVYCSYPQDATLSTNAREWWNTKHHMPRSDYFARKYLPFPAEEGDCERIFSKTGFIYCPRCKKVASIQLQNDGGNERSFEGFQFYAGWGCQASNP